MERHSSLTENVWQGEHKVTVGKQWKNKENILVLNRKCRHVRRDSFNNTQEF